jgi:3-oxoacyl-[acyl-carrier-protein] synthase-1
MAAVYIHDLAVACPLGASAAEVRAKLFAPAPPPVSDAATLIDGRVVPVGRLPFEPPAVAGARTRSNRLLAHLLAELAPAVEGTIEDCGPDRIGVVIGTSTSGMAEAEMALDCRLRAGAWPVGFRLADQELGDPARFAAERLGLDGPAYTVSTACTSGAKALASAARLIEAGLCDAAVCGGLDTLCGLTLNGFAALEAVADEVCNPFSRNRKGITIGEGGALFVLSRAPGPVRLSGIGESSDAHHINAPDPSGAGPEIALRQALAAVQLAPAALDYLHLHGTGTRLNDRMEAELVHRLAGDQLPCSSTKPLTGHMLGAAGAAQAAFCIMALDANRAPPHLWDGAADPALPPLRLVAPGERPDRPIERVMSVSYAFGGNNIALVLERA